nr:histidine-containing phosphotransfer protein 2-like [Ipomoea batatas]
MRSSKIHTVKPRSRTPPPFQSRPKASRAPPSQLCSNDPLSMLDREHLQRGVPSLRALTLALSQFRPCEVPVRAEDHRLPVAITHCYLHAGHNIARRRSCKLAVEMIITEKSTLEIKLDTIIKLEREIVDRQLQ